MNTFVNMRLPQFGKPGLLIIACTVLFISIFLVANTPISRFESNMGKKREQHKLSLYFFIYLLVNIIIII